MDATASSFVLGDDADEDAREGSGSMHGSQECGADNVGVSRGEYFRMLNERKRELSSGRPASSESNIWTKPEGGFPSLKKQLLKLIRLQHSEHDKRRSRMERFVHRVAAPVLKARRDGVCRRGGKKRLRITAISSSGDVRYVRLRSSLFHRPITVSTGPAKSDRMSLAGRSSGVRRLLDARHGGSELAAGGRSTTSLGRRRRGSDDGAGPGVSASKRRSQGAFIEEGQQSRWVLALESTLTRGDRSKRRKRSLTEATWDVIARSEAAELRHHPQSDVVKFVAFDGHVLGMRPLFPSLGRSIAAFFDEPATLPLGMAARNDRDIDGERERALRKLRMAREREQAIERERLWARIVRKDIPRLHKRFVASRASNSLVCRKLSILCSREVRRIHANWMRRERDVPGRARKLMRESLVLWKRMQREQIEMRRKEDHEEYERRKVEELEREERRQQKKLNFLLTQTELFSHFIANRGRAAGPDVPPELEIGGGGNDAVSAVGAVGGVGDMGPAETMGPAVRGSDSDDENGSVGLEAAIQKSKEAVTRHIDKLVIFDAEARERREVAERASKLQRPGAAAKARTGDEGAPPQQERGDNASSLLHPSTMPLEFVHAAPKMFHGTLKAYQLKGLNWLVNLYEQGLNGMLADEMGLGKTIQAIAFLGHLAEQKDIWGPFLVIAPTATLHNWQQEFARFCPRFKVLPYWGTQKDRKILRKYWTHRAMYTPAAPFHVMVTSYNLVILDDRHFGRVKWQYLILDEAQAVKSTASLRWKILLSFSCRNRLLMTGTPIQNNLAELWALLHFIMPTLFDSHKEFNEWFSRGIEGRAASDGAAGGEGGAGDAQDRAKDSQRRTQLTSHQLSRLHTILKPFMLRRVKRDVENEMAEKIEVQLMCELSPRQRSFYSAIRRKIPLAELLSTYSAGQSGKHVSERAAQALMNLVMQFRKVCNHPEIFQRRDVTSPLLLCQAVPFAARRQHLTAAALARAPETQQLLLAAAGQRGGGTRASAATSPRFLSATASEPSSPGGHGSSACSTPGYFANQASVELQLDNAQARAASFTLPFIPLAPKSALMVWIPALVYADPVRLFAYEHAASPCGTFMYDDVATMASWRGLDEAMLHPPHSRQAGRDALGEEAALGSPAAPLETPRRGAFSFEIGSACGFGYGYYGSSGYGVGVGGGLELQRLRVNTLCLWSPLHVFRSMYGDDPTGGRALGVRTVQPRGPPGRATVCRSGAFGFARLIDFSAQEVSWLVSATVFERYVLWQAQLAREAVLDVDRLHEHAVRPSARHGRSLLRVARQQLRLDTCGRGVGSLVLTPGDRLYRDVCMLSACLCPVTRVCAPPLTVLCRSRAYLDTYEETTPFFNAAPTSFVTHGRPGVVSSSVSSFLRMFLYSARPSALSLPFHPLYASRAWPESCGRPPAPCFDWYDVFTRRFPPSASVLLPRPVDCAPLLHAPFLLVRGATSGVRAPDMNVLLADSGKLKVLDELLTRMRAEGHKVLVYSQMTKMIDILEDYMVWRGHKFVRLDGSSKIAERRDTVRDFQTNSDIFVFLLSTRAGGLGLNLTAADTVVLYDSDWNPTMDLQAMDRAHRLGQTRQVTVYRLVTKGTIEERILQRAQQKHQIQNMVISGGEFAADGSGIFQPQEVVGLLLDEEEVEQRVAEAVEARQARKEHKRRPRRGGSTRASGVASSRDFGSSVRTGASVSDDAGGEDSVAALLARVGHTAASREGVAGLGVYKNASLGEKCGAEGLAGAARAGAAPAETEGDGAAADSAGLVGGRGFIPPALVIHSLRRGRRGGAHRGVGRGRGRGRARGRGVRSIPSPARSAQRQAGGGPR